MDIAPAILLSALLWQVVDFLRELANLPSSKSSVITQLTAWAGGVGVTVLAANATDLFQSFEVNGLALSSMNFASQLFLGLCIASVVSTGVDIKQALDGSDSAAKPPLLP